MFADDFQIYFSFSPNEVARAVESVNTDLRSVELWAEGNGLKLNAQKTQMICMGTSRGVRSVKAYVNSNPIQFMGTSLEFQESVRSLGMVLDEKLTWTAHTNEIVKRVNFRLKHLSTFRFSNIPLIPMHVSGFMTSSFTVYENIWSFVEFLRNKFHEFYINFEKTKNYKKTTEKLLGK
jgi:hypothetical protein